MQRKSTPSRSPTLRAATLRPRTAPCPLFPHLTHPQPVALQPCPLPSPAQHLPTAPQGDRPSAMVGMEVVQVVAHRTAAQLKGLDLQQGVFRRRGVDVRRLLVSSFRSGWLYSINNS